MNKTEMKNIDFIRFVNKNGFTNICWRCFIPNGECLDLAKQGQCRVYNDKNFKKLWETRK